MKRTLIACLFTVFTVTGARAAELTLDHYLHPQNENFRIFNTLFLDGAKSGLLAYNEFLIHRGLAPAFCLPPDLALTPEQAHDILIGYANSHPQIPGMFLSLVLLRGMIEKFPCPKSN